jgi:hypothetical protein
MKSHTVGVTRRVQSFVFGLKAAVTLMGDANGWVHVSMGSGGKGNAARDWDYRRANCWQEYWGWVNVRKMENRGDLVGSRSRDSAARMATS